MANKSQEAIEWGKWLASKEGQKCSEGTASGEYLKNRLWYAFFAGVDAGRKVEEQPHERT